MFTRVGSAYCFQPQMLGPELCLGLLSALFLLSYILSSYSPFISVMFVLNFFLVISGFEDLFLGLLSDLDLKY